MIPAYITCRDHFRTAGLTLKPLAMNFANSYTMSYLLPLSSLATVTFAQCLGGIEYKLSSYKCGPKAFLQTMKGSLRIE